jgi:hypothetical protein
MEKLGVENKELVKELEAKYLELKEKQVRLVKTGCAKDTFSHDLEDIKQKLDELKSQ